MYESDLIPLFDKCGTLWDLRLMMDPLTHLNKGYAFVTFTTKEEALAAVEQVGKGRERQKGSTRDRVSSVICLTYLLPPPVSGLV